MAVDHSEQSAVNEPRAAGAATLGDALEVMRLLRAAGSTLATQAGLHGQLARVAWAEEKAHLLTLLAWSLLGLACLCGALLFAGVLVLAFSWDTDYRVAAILLLLMAYGSGAMLALWRCQSLSAKSGHAWIASREELAADLRLLKSQL